MKPNQELFFLYIKLVLFNFDQRYNATDFLSEFSVTHATVTFDVTKVNAAFRVAAALGEIEADFSLDLNYDQLVSSEAVTQSQVLPDSISFSVQSWNQPKLERHRDKLLDFKPFL